MRAGRALLAAVLLGCLGRPLGETKAQTRGLQGYVLLFFSMVADEKLDERLVNRAEYTLDRELKGSLPNVTFEYRSVGVLSLADRQSLKARGEEVLIIQLSGDDNARTAEIEMDSGLHRIKRVHAATAQGATVPELCNEHNLIKIARLIRDHHDSCDVEGSKECPQ